MARADDGRKNQPPDKRHGGTPPENAGATKHEGDKTANDGASKQTGKHDDKG